MCRWRILRKYLIPTQTLTFHDLDLHHLFLSSFAPCLLPYKAPIFCVQPGFSFLQSFLELGSWSIQPWCLPHSYSLPPPVGSHVILLSTQAPFPFYLWPSESLTPSHYFPLTPLISFLPNCVDLIFKKSCDETLLLWAHKHTSSYVALLPKFWLDSHLGDFSSTFPVLDFHFFPASVLRLSLHFSSYCPVSLPFLLRACLGHSIFFLSFWDEVLL